MHQLAHVIYQKTRSLLSILITFIALKGMCLAHAQCIHKYIFRSKCDLSPLKSNSGCHLFPETKAAECGIPGAEPISLSDACMRR